jgi:hypothetical protein
MRRREFNAFIVARRGGRSDPRAAAGDAGDWISRYRIHGTPPDCVSMKVSALPVMSKAVSLAIEIPVVRWRL